MPQLRPHQQATLDWFIQSTNRGLFVLHATGSGKTITAIAIAEQMRGYKEVIVIAPKSLHDNFIGTLKKQGRESDVNRRYRFVSSNASNMIDKLETNIDSVSGIDVRSLHLDNKLIIVDEAHTLLVGMSNGSTNASALYEKLMKAKRCRMILMTASGVVNTVFEAVLALNICKGYIFSGDGERTTLLPESAEDFNRLFMDEKTKKLKNEDKLRMRIRGLVSYHGDLFERKVLQFFPMLNARIVKEFYPDRLPIKVVSVRMSGQQYNVYSQARDKEKLENKLAAFGRGPSPTVTAGVTAHPVSVTTHPVSVTTCVMGERVRETAERVRETAEHGAFFGGSTSYRIKSRQLSNVLLNVDGESDEMQMQNICTNVEIRAPKLKAIGDRIKPGRKALIYSNFVQAGIDPMAAYLEHLGYRRYEPPSHAKVHAKKASMKRMNRKGGAGEDGEEAVVTQDNNELSDSSDAFKPSASKLKEEVGEEQLQEEEPQPEASPAATAMHDTNNNGIHGLYGVYSGAVSTDDRTATLHEYNDPNSPLTVLLISSSGAEGLSTIGTRDVHIMEPYWNIERILQVMARGIRFRSHAHLPAAQRNVQVYMYLATAPKDIKVTEKTTDVYLFTEAARKYEINANMIRLMASASIECTQFNTKANFDCFECDSRDGAPPFLTNLIDDMQYPLPCKNKNTRSNEVLPVTAKELELNGTIYYLSDNERIFTSVPEGEGEYIEILDTDVRDWVLERASRASITD